MLPTEVDKCSHLQGQIRCLSELYNSLQSLRQVPSLVVRPPISNSFKLPTKAARQEFKELKDFAERLCSDPVQGALSTARNSEKADKGEIISSGRREFSLKRRRPPSPESPKPYVSPDRKTSSLFPKEDDEPSPLHADGLPDYIRQFNRSNTSVLHIWSRTRQPTNPIIVRFTIDNVLTAFITLGSGGEDPTLLVETVTAFGPRERKYPHSQSDYTAYHGLSQQVAKMVQSQPRVSFQAVMNLLCSYEGMFIDRCTSCERILSMEGHAPPVARIWTEGKEGDKGRWQPRHVSCLRG